MSSGKNGRTPCTAAPPTSGISTDSSMPYMCCGGTVATMCGVAPGGQRSDSAARFCRVLVRRLPQVLPLAPGRPVLPDVNPITTRAPSSTSGTGPGSDARTCGTRT
jgi:hypothetical protein